MKNKYIFIVIIYIFCFSSFAYVLSKTNNGSQIHWDNDHRNLQVFFNAQNSYGISESTLQTIATSSAEQWNFTGTINLSKSTTVGANQEGLNEVYFTDDPTVFNSSNSTVAGLTLVSYRETNGEIIEADVLINSNLELETSILESGYIGNILTHEFGHFLGLDHSQVIGSTMFYMLSLGQNTISDDDKAGLISIYNSTSSNFRSISGKVVGSRNLYGVYGVQIEAISEKTGKTMGAAITNTDGTFNINGLPISDRYFLYNKPAVASKLPSRYSVAKKNFCDGGANYRGSFFQACGGGNIGFPQAVSINSNDVDVGKITIRCGLDVPSDYYSNKGSDNFLLFENQNLNLGVGKAFVGFFSNQEMNNGTTSDQFKIDLSNISSSDWNSLSSSQVYLELTALSQSFYSPLKANVEVTNGISIISNSVAFNQDSDGWIDFNTKVRIPIDKASIANNYFSITVTPEKANTSDFVSSISSTTTISDILPDYSNFNDGNYFYLLNAHLVISNGDGTYSEVAGKNYTISDNSTCTDANNTYELSNYTTNTTSSSKRNAAVACGTVALNSDDQFNGPGGMLIGFAFAFILFCLLKKLRFV